MRHMRQNGFFLVIEYAYAYFRKEHIQKETSIPYPADDTAELHVLACPAV